MNEIQTNFLYASILLLATLLGYCAHKHKTTYEIRIGYKTILHLDLIKSCFLILSYMIGVVPLVLRTCGADTPTYYWSYVHERTTGVDFFFYQVLKILHSVIPNPQIGLGIISAISLLLIYVSIEMSSEIVDAGLSYFAFYCCIYFFMYNYLRMMLASSIVILGFGFILREKNIKGLVCFGIASLFHLSAILVLLSYFVVIYLRKRRKLVISMVLIMAAVFVLRPSVFLNLISVDRYNTHIAVGLRNTTIGFGTFLKAFPIIVVLLYYKKELEEYREYNILLISAILNFAISLVGYYVPVASRLGNMYFVMHYIFSVPWVFSMIKRQHNIQIINLIFLGYYMIQYYFINSNFVTMQIIPYTGGV